MITFNAERIPPKSDGKFPLITTLCKRRTVYQHNPINIIWIAFVFFIHTLTAEYRNKTHIYPRYPQIQLLLLLLSIRWSCVCRFSGFYFFPLLLLPNLFHSSSSCCDWPHKLKCFTTCHSYKSTHGLVENIHHISKAPLEEAELLAEGESWTSNGLYYIHC